MNSSTEPKPITDALRYVYNTGGGATQAHFIEDNAPVGEILWSKLSEKGYVTTTSEGRIMLTAEGMKLHLSRNG